MISNNAHLIIMKRKFKQSWSSIPSILTKQSPLILTELTEHKYRIMTNDVGTPGSGLRQAQQCGGFTPVNGIKPSHLFNLSTAWISNRN